jgi:Transcriptional regulator PadR-like family
MTFDFRPRNTAAGITSLTRAPWKSLLDSRGAVVVRYAAAPYMESTSSEVEWKKGSAELLILSLVEARPRHGYEISKLIEQRSEGAVRFYVASLYPLLYRLEKRG